MARKNLSKIPQAIIERIKGFELDDVVAACARRVKRDQVERYEHLGLHIENGALVIPVPKIPKPSAGRYSRANVEGKDIVRTDLSKYKKTFVWDTPNWETCHAAGTPPTWTERFTIEISFRPRNLNSQSHLSISVPMALSSRSSSPLIR